MKLGGRTGTLLARRGVALPCNGRPNRYKSSKNPPISESFYFGSGHKGTTGRGEARPTGCRSRTGAPCNKGVGDVGTGPNSRTEQGTVAHPLSCLRRAPPPVV
jgi:hypothetical protein